MGGRKAVWICSGCVSSETHILMMLHHLHVQEHTCTALLRSTTVALQTMQPQWDSFRLSLGLLRFQLSTHYPLSCWLNNTERGRGKQGLFLSGGCCELPELLQAIIHALSRPQGTHPSLYSGMASKRCRVLTLVTSSLEEQLNERWERVTSEHTGSIQAF